jgi:drug/metabolite transporter (DMT)-like permease
MLYEVGGKLVSESLLSLYPVLVKNLPVTFELQVWSRCFTYAAISLFFINWGFVQTHLLSPVGVLLSLVTTAHIYSSYQGFLRLESGTAYTLFYLYPILILLFSGEPVKPVFALAVIGVALLYAENLGGKLDAYGIAMIGLAAVTEAAIYFIVRRLKTDNNWNHLFLSYFAGAVIMTPLLYKQIMENLGQQAFSLSVLSNGFIGLVGYYLRFYATSRLTPSIYAPLSYFGVVMSHFYGFVINGEPITAYKTAGTLLIILANLTP